MATHVADSQSEQQDLLEQFLGSEKAPGAMPPLALDGYLTGVLLAPDLIRPSTWLEAIWGEEQPRFADIDEANAVVGAIMARYCAINVQVSPGLDCDPEEFPLPFDSKDMEAAQLWAEGFMAAVAVAPEAWKALMQGDEGAAALLAPFMMLASRNDADSPFYVANRRERAAMLRDGVDLLGAAISALIVFRHLQRAEMLEALASGGSRARKRPARGRATRKPAQKRRAGGH